jgi:hypothetical protein
MPKGTKILSAESYGNSAWTVTGKISTIQPDGKPKLYFLKVSLWNIVPQVETLVVNFVIAF